MHTTSRLSGAHLLALHALYTTWSTLLPIAAAQLRPEGLVGDESKCAERGVRAVECGADNPVRPDVCCKVGMVSYSSGTDDLYCSRRSGGSLHRRCWTAEDLADEGDIVPAADGDGVGEEDEEAQEAEEVDVSNCGKDGDRVIRCGSLDTDRPTECCPGYGCVEGSVECVNSNAEEGEGEEPEAQEFVAGNDLCAEDDEPSVECGGLGGDKAECCFGHYCDPDSSSSKCVKFDGCGGYGDRVIDCGEDNDNRPKHCCEGFVCARDAKGGSDNDIHCVAGEGNSELEPLDPIDPQLQDDPIDVNSNIVVVGTSYESARDSEAVKIDTPKNTEQGDLLLMFIGGSAGSNKRPSEPSGSGWEKFIEAGKQDLNLMALYKFYNGSDGDDEMYKIMDGKNTFVILTAIKGVDPKFPIVDAQATRNSAPGKDGRAIAPMAFGVRNGAVCATYVYDDPQVATIMTDGFHILSTSTTVQGDGMTAAVATTAWTGYTGTIGAAGSLQKGGGNDVAMTVTLRPEGGPYDDPPADDLPTDAPGPAPTGTAALTTNSTSAPVFSPYPTTPPPSTYAPTSTSDPPFASTPEPTGEPTRDPTPEPTSADPAEPSATQFESDPIDAEMIPSVATGTITGARGGVRTLAAAAAAGVLLVILL